MAARVTKNIEESDAPTSIKINTAKAYN